MSGIAPYHDAPNADVSPPPQCTVAAAAFLVRHSSIYANDDEYADYMEPFIARVYSAQERGVPVLDQSPLKFLKDWRSLVNETNLEDITPSGKDDARELGRRFRKLYGDLMPPEHLGKRKGDLSSWLKNGGKKHHKGKKVKTPFKVWSASSERDVESSKSFKICDAFTKESGKPHAQQWLETWGPAVLDRLNAHAPGWNFELNDVIAMFMLCGYETVISGAKTPSSPFCSADLFSPEEFRAFGYHQDLLYHYMVGYGAPTAPYLGVQWLNISTHNLLAAYAPDPHPNLLYVYFTHREEPPVALTALGLWNTSTEDLPDTMMPKDRLWKTSHLLPFLGHITIERLHCEADEDQDYVRVLVNGAPQPLPSCHDGPGGTCRLADFENFVRQRSEEFSDFEGACKKDDE
ncbi:uncharacterized protein RHOBADRAFT_34015 [Rhodotorula graminis WP1]|uniref:Phosphoglycerate mutase-like protein n=1 Tax=Rhodotorula graminis (strain WP1) TaxID=578459 RepID=A0A194SB54_RHOGW|nr:uncharacterized protein RHOBADRAFT_34015 [Rhodotorula graminis WP1]KPV77824.1 hypothetical protein RHOBADRAFT_34015 [Rhodotorula graminis WP1]